LLLVGTSHVSAQACNRKATAQRATVIYDQPPAFVTGKGLVYRQAVAKLLPGITVFVCREARVGFAFSTQLWYQVAYWRSAWSYGWVIAEDINLAGASTATGKRRGLATASAAQATESSAAPGGVQALTTPTGALVVPEKPPEGMDLAPPPAPEQPEARVDPRLLRTYYLATGLVLLAGIFAKVAIDSWNATKDWPKFRKKLRAEWLVPALTSPLVFLAFI